MLNIEGIDAPDSEGVKLNGWYYWHHPSNPAEGWFMHCSDVTYFEARQEVPLGYDIALPKRHWSLLIAIRWVKAGNGPIRYMTGSETWEVSEHLLGVLVRRIDEDREASALQRGE